MINALRELVHRATGADDRPIPYRPAPRLDDSDDDVVERSHDHSDPRTHDWRTLYDDRTEYARERGDVPISWSCSECDGPPEPKEPDMSGHCLCHDAAVCPDELAGSLLDDRD